MEAAGVTMEAMIEAVETGHGGAGGELGSVVAWPVASVHPAGLHHLLTH